MGKKTFEALEQFVTMPGAIQEEPIKRDHQEKPTEAPKGEANKYTLEEAKSLLEANGYKTVEYKTKRLNLLIRPSIYEKLKRRASEEGISVNSLIDNIITKHLEEEI